MPEDESNIDFWPLGDSKVICGEDGLLSRSLWPGSADCFMDLELVVGKCFIGCVTWFSPNS